MITPFQNQLRSSRAQSFRAGLLAFAICAALPIQAAEPVALPVRGIHLTAPSKRDFGIAEAFIRDTLPKMGVNTLILEFNFNFDFQSRPEFADDAALGKVEARRLSALCREKGINLIPQINCLGHQSWSKTNGRLLQKHPEFDETPGKHPDNKDIYCRSYCPLHPEVHRVLFALMDELADACEARDFHVGMDEVFILGDPDCKRCRGKSNAELFGAEVKTLHQHLASTQRRMWMWGDRFLDAKSTGLGKWEASDNGTYPAIDLAPKDIVICDWHYDSAPDTARLFAQKGFDVVACPWRKLEPALGQLKAIRSVRNAAEGETARHALGIVQTTWCGFAAFAKAFNAQSAGAAPEQNSASEAARCFVTLFDALK